MTCLSKFRFCATNKSGVINFCELMNYDFDLIRSGYESCCFEIKDLYLINRVFEYYGKGGKYLETLYYFYDKYAYFCCWNSISYQTFKKIMYSSRWQADEASLN